MHYIVVIIFIVIILGFQIKIVHNTLKKIKAFKSIFPKADSDYSTQNTIIGNIPVNQIAVANKNTTMSNIIGAINNYLCKNVGAASDFALIKDIVERYSSAEEEEITVLQPIPLYAGLMGTMIGIIVGIVVIAVEGGIENLKNISSMMTCVAIAMFASLIGIFFTTTLSLKAKGAKSAVEANKNIFYSWFQTQLLPVISQNAYSQLHLLQQNLSNFNSTFGTNVQQLQGVFGNISTTTQQQAALLESIQNLDAPELAKSNIKVLKEFKQCVSEIENFNQYLKKSTEYLKHVRELSDKLDANNERTLAIVNMGQFFEKEIEHFKEREEYIKTALSSVDQALNESFNEFKANNAICMKDFQESSSNIATQLKETLEKEKEAFEKVLHKIKENFDTISKDSAFFSNTNSIMEKIVASAERHNSKLDELLKAIKSKAVSDNKMDIGGKNKYLRPFALLTCAIIIVVSILNIYDFIERHNKAKDKEDREMLLNSDRQIDTNINDIPSAIMDTNLVHNNDTNKLSDSTNTTLMDGVAIVAK